MRMGRLTRIRMGTTITSTTDLGPAPGSTLLLIGACGGIGHAVYAAAQRRGVRVIAMDLEDSLTRRGIEFGDDTIPVDLLDEISIKSAFGRLIELGAKLDAVAVCSGYTSGHDRIADHDTDRFDNVLSGNLRGPVLALREATPLLNDGAKVVLLTTAIGQVGAPGYAAYGAAKAGLNAITRILAAELAPGAIVNAVAPGAVDTAFIRGGYGTGAAENGTPERIDPDEYVKLVPLGRMAEPDDIVGPVLFLLSDAARYITGQVLHVNGGAFMRD